MSAMKSFLRTSIFLAHQHKHLLHEFLNLSLLRFFRKCPVMSHTTAIFYHEVMTDNKDSEFLELLILHQIFVGTGYEKTRAHIFRDQMNVYVQFVKKTFVSIKDYTRRQEKDKKNEKGRNYNNLLGHMHLGLG